MATSTYHIKYIDCGLPSKQKWLKSSIFYHDDDLGGLPKATLLKAILSAQEGFTETDTRHVGLRLGLGELATADGKSKGFNTVFIPKKQFFSYRNTKVIRFSHEKTWI